MLKTVAKTFFFYDLETSGLNPRTDRIMQFAGQRTGMDLNPIGEPVNLLVKLNDDTLPSPDAIMVTGITPQKTLEDGYSEAEFSKILINDIFTTDTITVGFNNIRFDDEFIRYLLWRNFYDPYEWAWKDGRSRWDMLDIVRMTRALRPEGIEWPVNDQGEPANRLELITKQNGIVHESAHDAMSDVEALIDVTKMIRTHQPQLFEYLLKMREKKEVQKIINLDDKKPFVYTSGRYDGEFAKTTVALPIAPAPNSNVLVYDLRYDPSGLFDLSVEELRQGLFASWEERQQDSFRTIPVKQLQYNRAPAIAPLGVLEKEDAWNRIGLTSKLVQANFDKLMSRPDFGEKLRTAFEERPEFEKLDDPEALLYDNFLGDRDRLRVEVIRNSTGAELIDLHPGFQDERLPGLLLHYKARNFSESLAEDEVTAWEQWRSARITSDLPGFYSRLAELAKTDDKDKQFILQELQLWAELIAPED